MNKLAVSLSFVFIISALAVLLWGGSFESQDMGVVPKIEQDEKQSSTDEESTHHHNHVHHHHGHSNDHQVILEGNQVFDDTPEGKKLTAYYNLLESTEVDAQERMNKMIEEMKEEAQDFSNKLQESYHQLERSQFLGRYKVIFMLESLKTSHATVFLSELANSKIPEPTEPYKGDGYVDESEHEVKIRMRAIGGLYALAKEGDKDAHTSLLDVVSQTSDLSLKRDAVWAYLSSSSEKENDTEYVKQLLTEEEQFMLNLEMDSPAVAQDTLTE